MRLPITETELNIILEVLKHKNQELYNKLWSYKINKKLEENKWTF